MEKCLRSGERIEEKAKGFSRKTYRRIRSKRGRVRTVGMLGIEERNRKQAQVLRMRRNRRRSEDCFNRLRISVEDRSIQQGNQTALRIPGRRRQKLRFRRVARSLGLLRLHSSTGPSSRRSRKRANDSRKAAKRGENSPNPRKSLLSPVVDQDRRNGIVQKPIKKGSYGYMKFQRPVLFELSTQRGGF